MATMFAGAGGGGAAAQGGLLQLHGEASAHLIHDRQHLIEGDELAYAAEGELRRHQGVCHAGGVAVLAGVFHSPPTGSHTSPSIFIITVEAASRHCSGLPPMSSTAAEAAMAEAMPTSAWQPPTAPATVALRMAR